MTTDEKGQWRSDIENCPMNELVLVAYHGHGVNQATLVRRVARTGNWGDWDYINSHDGEPKYWMPLNLPDIPDDIAGPNCGCDGCTEAALDEEP